MSLPSNLGMLRTASNVRRYAGAGGLYQQVEICSLPQCLYCPCLLEVSAARSAPLVDGSETALKQCGAIMRMRLQKPPFLSAESGTETTVSAGNHAGYEHHNNSQRRIAPGMGSSVTMGRYKFLLYVYER